MTIDGVDIREYTLNSLRSQIAMVLQPPLIFPLSVADNIAYGRPGADREAIENAARLARIHDTIARMPEGYETLLGEGGVALSEGEKQRITIARALLRDAPILILDEPTSALDVETEALVMEAIETADAGPHDLHHRASAVDRPSAATAFSCCATARSPKAAASASCCAAAARSPSTIARSSRRTRRSRRFPRSPDRPEIRSGVADSQLSMLRDCRVIFGLFAGIAEVMAAGVAVLPVYRQYTGTVVSAVQIDPSSCRVPDGSSDFNFFLIFEAAGVCCCGSTGGPHRVIRHLLLRSREYSDSLTSTFGEKKSRALLGREGLSLKGVLASGWQARPRR